MWRRRDVRKGRAWPPAHLSIGHFKASARIVPPLMRSREREATHSRIGYPSHLCHERLRRARAPAAVQARHGLSHGGGEGQELQPLLFAGAGVFSEAAHVREQRHAYENTAAGASTAEREMLPSTPGRPKTEKDTHTQVCIKAAERRSRVRTATQLARGSLAHGIRAFVHGVSKRARVDLSTVVNVVTPPHTKLSLDEAVFR